MPQTQVDETQVNELDENPLEDLFNRPSNSPRMDMLGGGFIEKSDSESCPEGQEWDENAQACVPIVEDDVFDSIVEPIKPGTEIVPGEGVINLEGEYTEERVDRRNVEADIANLQLTYWNKKQNEKAAKKHLDQRQLDADKVEEVMNNITYTEERVGAVTSPEEFLSPSDPDYEEKLEDIKTYEETLVASSIYSRLGYANHINYNETKQKLNDIGNDADFLTIPGYNYEAVDAEGDISLDDISMPGKDGGPNLNVLDWDFISSMTLEERAKFFDIRPDAEAAILAVLLEDQPDNTDLRDLFKQFQKTEGEEGSGILKFQEWSVKKWNDITSKDPLLQAYARIASEQIGFQTIQKQRELYESIIGPCAEENEGVATDECQNQALAELEIWQTAELQKLFYEDPNVKSIIMQYGIGIEKVLGRLYEPLRREEVPEYALINKQLKQQGIFSNALFNDAWLKDDYTGENVDIYNDIIFSQEGTRGSIHRQKLLEIYDDPAIKTIIDDFGLGNMKLSEFGGVMVDGGGYDSKGIKAGELDTTYIRKDGKMIKDPEFGEDFSYDRSQRYMRTVGVGCDKEGAIKEIAGEDAHPRWRGLESCYVPIDSKDFHRLQDLVTGLQAWARGGKSGSMFNQNYLARVYGGTDDFLENVTVNSIFSGNDAGIEGIFEYDQKAKLKLLERTAKMMELEELQQLGLDPDTDLDFDFQTMLRHLIMQKRTMVPMYAGSIMTQIGKVASKAGGWGKAVGIPMQATGIMLQAIGSVNILAQEYTSNIVETWRTQIMEENGGKNPTSDEWLAKLEEPDAVDKMLSFMMASGSLGLEKVGIEAMLGGSRLGTKAVFSLFRGEFVKMLKRAPKALLATALAGGGEGLTELFQGYIHSVTVNLGLNMGWGEAMAKGEYDWAGFNVGTQIGVFMPVSTNMLMQSTVELRQVGYEIASKITGDGAFKGTFLDTWANSNKYYKDATEEVRRRMAKNEISQEDGHAVINELSNLRNSGMQIPTTMHHMTKKRMLNLLLSQKSIEGRIKQTDNKTVSEGNGDLNALKLVNEEIIALQKREQIRQQYLKMEGNVTDVIEKHSKGKIKIVKAKTTKQAGNEVNNLKEEGWKVNKKMSSEYGFILQKGDQQVIVLNQAESVKGGAINTAAHEFLHALIYQTVKNSKGTAIALGNNLLTYIKGINPDLMKNTDFAERVKQYQQDDAVSSEDAAEEILTLFSEAVLDGALEIEQGAWNSIGAFITNILESLGLKDIRFDDGKDVYNFIKNYNRNIQKGKLNIAQQQLLDKAAEGELVKRKYTRTAAPAFTGRKGGEYKEDSDVKLSKKKLTELTTQWQKGAADVDVETDILPQLEAATISSLKRWGITRPKSLTFDLSNPEVMKEIKQEVGKELWSFMENFDETKSSATTYTDNLAKRIGPRLVKILAKPKGQKDITAQELENIAEQETEEAKGKEFEKRKYPTDIAAIEKQTADVRPEILKNIKNSVKQFIASSVGKVKEIGGKGKTVITKLDPSLLAKELKAQNRATETAVRNAMGKSVKAQNDFIKKVINDGYIETIPIAAMKKRFKTVKGFNIEKIGRETLGAGTGIYKLSGLNKQALIDFYTKDQSGRRSFIDLLSK